MKILTELLGAIAAILWPLLAFWIVRTFEREICSLLERIQKGKILGQEFELRADTKALHAKAEDAAKAIAPGALLRKYPLENSNASDAAKQIILGIRSRRNRLLLSASQFRA